MQTYDLKPAFNQSQKSFYGKARIVEDQGSKLFSYDTLVAEKKDGVIYIYKWHSKTTMRHINAFLCMYGLDELHKKDVVNGKTIKL